MLVVALPGGGTLAAKLAQALKCDWSELALHRFPDGETLVRLDVPVAGRCVVLAGSLNQPDEKTLPLLFAADAARDQGAAQVGLVAPYLAYMRQDRQFNAGEAVTSRSYARLLSSALDFLVTVDPHLHRWHSLDEIYPIRTKLVSSAAPIARWLRRSVKLPLIVGPDKESEPWVVAVADLLDAPWTVLKKTRRGDRDVTVQGLASGLKALALKDIADRTPVLLDDIVSTGETMMAAVAALKRAGLAAPVCVGVHALFGADTLWRLGQAGASRVVTCDSITHASNAIALAPVLAKAVLAVAKERR